jgi:hypothetical protein
MKYGENFCKSFSLQNLYMPFSVPLYSVCKIWLDMNAQPSSASQSRRAHARGQARLRGFIGISMIVLWAIVALTGFLLEFAPSGQRSGQLVIFLLTKTQWGDIHYWMSIAAGALTLIHLIVDWKALKACARYLVSSERGEKPCE